MYQDFCNQVVAYNSKDDIPRLVEILSCPGFDPEVVDSVIRQRDDLTHVQVAKKWIESIRGGLYHYHTTIGITHKGARDAVKHLGAYFDQVEKVVKGKKKMSVDQVK